MITAASSSPLTTSTVEPEFALSPLCRRRRQWRLCSVARCPTPPEESWSSSSNLNTRRTSKLNSSCWPKAQETLHLQSSRDGGKIRDALKLLLAPSRGGVVCKLYRVPRDVDVIVALGIQISSEEVKLQSMSIFQLPWSDRNCDLVQMDVIYVI